MARNFDLLGDPIPENHGKPGANGHTPTAETLRKVRVLMCAGVSKKLIAADLGITFPTLNKHYFHSGRVNARHAREMALAEQRGRSMLQLDKAAEAGNVAAQKAMLAIVDQAEMELLASDAAEAPAKKSAAPLPKGKKQALQAGASEAIDGDDLLNPEVYH